MNVDMANYRSWAHVGIPGFDHADVSRERGPVASKYVRGVKLKSRWGEPMHYSDAKEYGRFEVVVTGRVAITESGEPAKRDLRKPFTLVDVVDECIGEVVISNGNIWGVVTIGATAWGRLEARHGGKSILMFQYRLNDIDTVSLRLDGGLRRQSEYPVVVTSLLPGGLLQMEARRSYSMPGHKGTKVKTSRPLFDAILAAAVDHRLPTAEGSARAHLEEIRAGGHRDTSEANEVAVDLNAADHDIFELDEHGLRVDRPHWSRPKAQ